MGSIQLSPIQLLILFGAVNGVILCGLLYFTKRNTKAAKWMGLFVAAVTINKLNYSFISQIYHSVDWFTLVRIPTLYSYGVLIWLYTNHLVHPNFKLSKWQKWLLVPFFADVLYSFLHAGYIYYAGLEQKEALFYVPAEHLIHEGIAIVYNISMYVLAYLEVHRHNQRIFDNYSTIKAIDLRWLQILFILILLPNIVWIGLYFLECWYYPAYLSFDYYYPIWGYTTIFSMVLAYRSLLQPQLDYEALSKVNSSRKEKYQNSTLSVNQIKRMSEQLREQVETKELFLIPDLKLADLAQELDLPSHQLSQIISEGLQTNFYDFINRYRVEAVKHKLLNGEANHFDLLSIAFACGFNSKTAFYTAFKKYVGTSPSQYRRTHKR